MNMWIINRNRDFLPQGSDAPVGMARGMRWRLPVERIWTYPGEDPI